MLPHQAKLMTPQVHRVTSISSTLHFAMSQCKEVAPKAIKGKGYFVGVSNFLILLPMQAPNYTKGQAFPSFKLVETLLLVNPTFNEGCLFCFLYFVLACEVSQIMRPSFHGFLLVAL